MTRTFVAIEMPEPVASALGRLVRGLEIGRRVPPENLHLTLAFLGDVFDESLADLNDALGAIRQRPVDIAFTGLGHFGDRHPRSLHVGVEAVPALHALHTDVMKAARRAGLHPERRKFVPHVTLARFGAGLRDTGSLARFLAQGPRDVPTPLLAVDMALMASDLHPSGARYEALARYPLTGR